MLVLKIRFLNFEAIVLSILRNWIVMIVSDVNRQMMSWVSQGMGCVLPMGVRRSDETALLRRLVAVRAFEVVAGQLPHVPAQFAPRV